MKVFFFFFSSSSVVSSMFDRLILSAATLWQFQSFMAENRLRRACVLIALVRCTNYKCFKFGKSIRMIQPFTQYSFLSNSFCSHTNFDASTDSWIRGTMMLGKEAIFKWFFLPEIQFPVFCPRPWFRMNPGGVSMVATLDRLKPESIVLGTKKQFDHFLQTRRKVWFCFSHHETSRVNQWNLDLNGVPLKWVQVVDWLNG